ncbi:MerR family transcriptional regulator, redox-sensitive transcriptional activator SoxR [Pseudoalteromonas citrea]|uniref:Redox-sensitive transcriptional activator SoxR n=2 Tax=Pseudoalteromonas citrea TaxID=43655 RepID=A0AAD4FPQ7_9GAMM|nr:redox-sensitive transcriptional activator SoxR [Pseudoalteromonas citrea]KAF7764355.1 MerR family transcriptional regulator, redox-sensitive transcriptional activator SoxR [Pseudoalteromonas citrea]
MEKKPLQDANLAVGYVAKRSDVNISTLHFYETKGLIRSWRNNGNQRRYKPDVLRRIAVIKAAQKMGVTLEEIKLTLDTLPQSRTPNKNDWAKLSTQWQAQLDEKIAYMQRLRERVEGCIGCGCLSMSSCPLYNPNDILGETHSGAVLLEKD